MRLPRKQFFRGIASRRQPANQQKKKEARESGPLFLCALDPI